MFVLRLRRADIEQVLGAASPACIPNNYSLVREAIDRGVPLDEVKPGNKITLELKKLIAPPEARSRPRRKPGRRENRAALLGALRFDRRRPDRGTAWLAVSPLARRGARAWCRRWTSRRPRSKACPGRSSRAGTRAGARAVANPLLSDKLLDAKVRLHRRLIEEINLSALEKLPEDEIRGQVQQLVAQYVLVERLALNAQELDDFVYEILDEMTGLGPLEPLLKDPTINDILINGHECVYVERAACSSRRRALQGRGAPAAHRQQDRLGGRPPRRRIAADVRRAPARRLARQRRGAADRGRRPAGLDPQVLQEAVQPRPAGRGRQRCARRWRSCWPRPSRRASPRSSRAAPAPARPRCSTRCRPSSRQGAPGHHRGRGRAAAAAAACRPHGDAAAQHRGQGRDPPARAGQERAAHAPRPHHPRRVPRRGSLRHAAGDEHRPRRLDDDHPRQHAARRALAPRADDRHGRPADDGRVASAARSPPPSASSCSCSACPTASARSPRSPRSPAWRATSSRCRRSTSSCAPAPRRTAP